MRKSLPLHIQILFGILLGLIVGFIFGPQAAPLGELGKIVIQLIKILAAPLLFFAIIAAFLHTEVKGKAGLRMVSISLTNSVIAIIIGLTISNVFQPGRHFQLNLSQSDAASSMKFDKFKISDLSAALAPKSFLAPFVENATLTIIIIAVLLGLALKSTRKKYSAAQFQSVQSLIEIFFSTFEIVLSWIVKLIPLAVFAVIAKSFGENGFNVIKGLAVYLIVGLGGLLIHVIFVYHSWLYFVSKMSLRRFWSGIKEPVIYVMGSSSSLATLPITLKALDKMKVTEQSSRLAACIGTNLNNDGIILYEAMAVLFVAQAYGIELSLAQQVLAAGACLVAGIGISGIPDAGLISLAIVLTTVGLPSEALPILLTVDWIMGRARAVTNVISDCLVAVLLDRFDK